MKKDPFQPECNAVVLAAGASERYGSPKYSLIFDQNRNFVQKIMEEYVSFGCEQVVIVIRPDDIPYFDQHARAYPEKVYVAVNHHPEKGRLSSIQTGLQVLKTTHKVFLQNVDNPFVDKSLLRSLADQLKENKGVFPGFNGKGGHPVLFSKILASQLIQLDQGTDFKLFVKSQNFHSVEVGHEKILANINTKEDYQRWFGK